LTPVLPPRILAVYCVEFARAVDGCRTAVRVAAVYETVAGTSTFDGLRSSKVAVETVLAFTASLNVALTGVLATTPVAPFAGLTDDTVGGVVSGPTDVVNTRSTQ